MEAHPCDPAKIDLPVVSTAILRTRLKGGEQMRIVVIEDEYNTRVGIVRLIGKLGSPYEVVGEAEDGIEGLQVIEETEPDMVITDIKMPHLSGIEMLERMESRGFRYQTIILTGYSEFEYARKALRLGVCEYLEKPIEVEDLQNTFEKVNRELTFQRLTGITNGHPQVRTELILQQAMTREEIDYTELAHHLEPTEYDATQKVECVLLYLGELFEQKGEMLKTCRDMEEKWLAPDRFASADEVSSCACPTL
jgi:two-component system response regulator YesN